MQLVTFLIEHYFAIPYQKYTSKIIAALGIFQAIESDQRTKKSNEKIPILQTADYKELKFIEENTAKDIMVSLYKLDRTINPSTDSFIESDRIKTFRRNDWRKRDSMSLSPDISLSEDSMEYVCSKAIRRVNDIVIRNIKAYSDEFKLLFGSQQDDSISLGSIK